MPHIAEGLLHAHLDGALGPDEQLQWTAAERHLEQCADCRERLEEARALRSSARDLLAGATPPATETGPGFEALAAEAARRRAGGADGAPASRTGSTRRDARGTGAWWWSTARLAWAASLVMAAAAGWIGHELLMEQGGTPRPVAETAIEEPAGAGAEGRRTEAADVAGDAARNETERALAAEERAALAPQTLAQKAGAEPRCFAVAEGTEADDLEDDIDADAVSAGSLRGLRLAADGTLRARSAAGSLVGFWGSAATDSLVLRLTDGDGWRELRFEESTDELRGTAAGTAVSFRRIDCRAF